MVQVVFISCVLLVIFLSLIPGPGTGGGQYMDKIAHAASYGVLGVLAYVAFDSLGKRVVIFIFIFLLGVSLEFFQLYIPERSASVYDVAANTAGLALSVLLCWVYSLIPTIPPPGADKLNE